MSGFETLFEGMSYRSLKNRRGCLEEMCAGESVGDMSGGKCAAENVVHPVGIVASIHFGGFYSAEN